MLETSRLILKQQQEENLEKMHQWLNDPELVYYCDEDPEPYQPRPIEATEKYMKRLVNCGPNAEKDIIHYGIHKKEDGMIIGYGMIALIDRYHRKCNLGIVIGEKDEWSKGYAIEALQGVIRYCFEKLDMNRIGGEIYSINPRSVRLFENLGFKREGVCRQSVLKKGKYADEYIYGLLREEWKSLK